MDIIFKYFPDLTKTQVQQLQALGPLYREWNDKINVISRKDIGMLYERHILHSMAIGKIIEFRPGTKIMDAGTGGGLPGIPMAILFPQAHFFLADSIGKKIKVAGNIAAELGLKNVKTSQVRAEMVNKQFDFIISRAVTSLPVFIQWFRGKILKDSFNNLSNGILYLKGGDLQEELLALNKKYDIYKLADLFEEEFFETKKLVHIRY
jgi:16S rRNA (guanine527-N7)-methyltransferase